jgi:hypothetical protein
MKPREPFTTPRGEWFENKKTLLRRNVFRGGSMSHKAIALNLRNLFRTHRIVSRVPFGLRGDALRRIHNAVSSP